MIKLTMLLQDHLRFPTQAVHQQTDKNYLLELLRLQPKQSLHGQVHQVDIGQSVQLFQHQFQQAKQFM